jgi:hypothetical protein
MSGTVFTSYPLFPPLLQQKVWDSTPTEDRCFLLVAVFSVGGIKPLDSVPKTLVVWK